MKEDILLRVQKPARYIGREWNVSRKDFDSAFVKFALCFPDLYELGMSNLGVRILYGILNDLEGVCCERFFSVGADMEQVLRSRQEEVLSLESGRRLGDFDLIGISIPHELNYTNILTLLDLSGTPLLSVERDNTHPLVIGGGPGVMNPEPLHAFFDFFVFGEGEEISREIIELYRSNKTEFRAGRLSREELLVRFAGLEGVYVPSLYETEYGPDGSLKEFRPKAKGIAERIKKRFVKNLDESFFPAQWLVPYIQIVHDRITIEIMRGCPNACRFCSSRTLYFPFRQRSVQSLLGIAEEAYRLSGYEEISLAGLSVSDYAGIESLLKKMTDSFYACKVGISLPSIKPKSYLGNVSELIASIRKTGLTFAPEAGSERLRKVVGKDFNGEDFHTALLKAYASGYQHVKLYFLMGLPTETDADLDKIIEFAEEASRLRKETGRGAAQVNISVNALIPKPHTPFQWLAMLKPDEIEKKQVYLRKRVKNRRMKLNFHNRYMSALEGIFSRGDRRLSRVILSAFKKGARFDAWQDSFNFALWESAFNECGLDPESYLKERPREGRLPWSFLDPGISTGHLLSEFNKLLR